MMRVIKSCADYNIQQKYETIKQWFNGYIFGETNVYNPWSVMQYVDDLKANINRLSKSYLANTISNSIVKSLIERADEAIKQIEDRKYDMELRSEGYKNIFKYGIAFYKKDCLIKIKD